MHWALLAVVLVPLWSGLLFEQQHRGTSASLRWRRGAPAAAAPAPRYVDSIDGITAQWLEQQRNRSLVAALRAEGKISPEGFPDLVFVHIPKAAGVAIKKSLAPLYPYGQSKQTNLALVKLLKGGGSSFEKCYFEQAPPFLAAELFGEAAAVWYRGRDVFCAVRNPYDRIVSAYCYLREKMGSPEMTASAADLNRFIHEELLEFEGGDYTRRSCFWVPQADFARGPSGCRHVLDFEHLGRDFGRLMARFGYNLTLRRAGEGAKENSAAAGCSLTRLDLYWSTRRLIERVYSDDFREFGPKVGWA